MNRKAFWGWLTFWASFGIFDFWRDTKTDGSTLSDVVIALLDKTGHPKAVCASVLAAGGTVLFFHFTKDAP